MTRVEVYNDYSVIFPGLQEAVLEWLTTRIPYNAFSFSAFILYWDISHSTLRISKPGTDFIDFCTFVQGDFLRLHSLYEWHACLQKFLHFHRDAARRDHSFYSWFLTSSTKTEDGSSQHLVFDVAEKVIFPCLINQPGRIYFVPGLKFYLFGVHNRNKGVTFIYGLLEGHWIN